MSYTVRLTKAAQKQMSRLDAGTHRRIVRRLEELEKVPRPPGVEKLAGKDVLYRVRAGDWRIIYTIEDEQLLVLVVNVGNRREVYRDL
jgi:mRNA interferase RelE/StbE